MERPSDVDESEDDAGSTGRVTVASSGSRHRTAPFRVHTATCTGKSAKDLFSVVALELGWPEVDVEARISASTKKSTRATIYCVMQTSDMLDVYPVMNPRSWISRYLGMPDLCDKGTFARVVWACQDLVEPGAFAFYPKTWVLPDQLEDVRAKLGSTKKTYIVKPEDGSQGDGIFLVQGVRDLDIKLSAKANKSAVVQRYIEKPCLLGGIKFDFRLYVCVIGGSLDDPPRVYLCREGLGRMCTEAYEEPSSKNMHKCMAHLTNYSLNKRSELFEHSGENMQEVYDLASTASKRPMTVVLRQLQAEHPDFDIEEFYDRAVALTRTTMALMAPVLTAFHRSHSENRDMRCFQVLGFDVMLDERFAPYLLEANNSPSLCIDEALPLDPASPEPVGGRPSRTRERDKVCNCMDMAQPHWHQTAFVDYVVKKTVMCGAFRLLQQLNAGEDEPTEENYMEADIGGEGIYAFLHSIDQLFHRSGGGAKAFTSAGLRRTLGSVCGTGGLEKHDLDTLSLRFRGSQFTSRERHVKPDSLRLFEYLQVLKLVGARAFPGAASGEAVRRLLAALGR